MNFEIKKYIYLRQRYGETERRRDRETERWREGEMERRRDGETERWRNLSLKTINQFILLLGFGHSHRLGY